MKNPNFDEPTPPPMPDKGAALSSIGLIADLERSADAAWDELTKAMGEAVTAREIIDSKLSAKRCAWQEAYSKLKAAQSAIDEAHGRREEGHR